MSAESHDNAIAVFEIRPYWGPELKRQFVNYDLVVLECRSVIDLNPILDRFDCSLVVLDLDAALVDCLQWLDALAIKHSTQHSIIGIGSSDCFELEWILRDAGIVALVPNTIAGDDVARLCRRQFGLMRHFD